MTAREAAYKSLISTEKSGKYSNIELSSSIAKGDLSDADRALYTSIFYGVIEKTITLDCFISFFSSKPIKRLDTATLILLRMGIYQIVFSEKIPDSAAVNETVKLAARYSARSRGFVNALLRKVCAQKDSLPYPDKNSDRLSYLSVLYSIPRWICELWESDYPDRLESMLEAVSKKPLITLRVNTKVTDRDTLLEKYDYLEPCEFSPFGLRLTRSVPIGDIAPLRDGECFVQDEVSQLATLALDPRDGDTVVDACAAPGGKSFGAALLMHDSGSVLSLDVHENKLSLIENEAKKLGLSTIKTAAHDSAEPIAEMIGRADRVICDVPCSGLGVISKKSDLRYNAKEDARELCDLQYRILTASSKYLAVGGVLVYSTCTLRKAENEDNVARFLQENSQYKLLPFEIGTLRTDNGMLTLFPGTVSSDGFFIAKITRKE